MTEKILVFGANGRVGSSLIKALPADTPIRAVDLAPQQEGYPTNVEYLSFDINNTGDRLPDLFEQVRQMFLLWPPGVNVKQSIGQLIQAAADAGVQHVVFLSILGADRLKIVPHRVVEKMLENSGLDWVFIRSAYFMQNLSGIHAHEIRTRDTLFIPAGSGTLGFIDVRDVAEVIAKALTENHLNAVYSLTGGEALSFPEVALKLSRVLGRIIKYTNPGPLHFFREMRKRNIPAGLVVFMLIEYTATRMGKSGLVTGEVQRLLNRPAIRLEQFIADFQGCWTPEAAHG